MTVRKVSVITVCLNVRDCIRLTLDSVARQTCINIEHLVIDGGSTDGTQSIVKEYEVGYFVSEKDNGVYDAMDKGAKAATGDILIFLNAGDTFYDDRTSEDVAAFFDKTGADIVFGNLMPVYLKPTDSHDHGAFTSGKLLDLGYIKNRRQLFDESIHHQATFYRRWIFKHCTYLCPSPEASGEYNVLLKATIKHNAQVKHIQRPVARFALGGISTRNFAHEWSKYVNAREILRNYYCPSITDIRLINELEFCHANYMQPNRLFMAKQRLKALIKKSITFRVYQRLSVGLSTRIVNALTPSIQSALQAQTQTLFSDLTHIFEKNIQAHLKEKIGQLNQIDGSIKATIEELEPLINRSIQAVVDEAHQQFKQHDVDNKASINEVKISVARDIESVNLGVRNLHRLAIQSNVNLADVYFKANKSDEFSGNGFKVFSQWDEDGLIQYLISRIFVCEQSFVEIGVGDYSEANTRLLLEKNNWKGLIIDCGIENIERIKSSEIYWRYSLNAIQAFVDCDNVNKLLLDNCVTGDIGLLSIDVDGVDYWIWNAITAISPKIVIIEYNGIFGSEAKVTIPYNPKFDRTKSHYSWLYAGASLAALRWLARKKGYTLVGTNNGGNNAFFVRDDVLMSSTICPSEIPYRRPMFRESRDIHGALSYLDIQEAIKLIGDMEVYDVEKQMLIKIHGIPIKHGTHFAG